MAKKTTKKNGEIKVTVQQADRLSAINNLSEAINNVSKALAENVSVEIINNKFNGAGITIDTSQEVKKTIIKEGE